MKRLVYLTMAIVMLLALLPAVVVAQETHYFTWTPTTPNEGGSATFTATYTGAYIYMILTGAATPGGECNQVIAEARPPETSMTGSHTFGASGNYLVCLTISPEPDGSSPIYDNQTVTVLNTPPYFTGDFGIGPEPSTAGQPIYGPFAAFADYDPTETWVNWTCRVNYGDGTGWLDATWEFPINGYNDCKGPDHVYDTAGTYNITFEVTEPGVGPGTVTLPHVVESAGPPGPGVKDITITSKAGRNNYTYTGLVLIGDDQGPLSKVAVTAEWWQISPDGTATPMATQTASTNRDGVAKFTLRAPNGTYDLCVTQLVKKGYEFPPDVVCYSHIHPQ